MNFASRSPSRALALAILLSWLTPRESRAEGSIAYKYESYQESRGRIGVQTREVQLQQDLPAEIRLKLDGVIDAITGATPNGVPAPAGSDQVPTSDLRPERRKSWNAGLARQFQRVNLDFGFGNSRESDYVSNGWSVNTLTDFNQKNTTLLAGLAGTDDKIKVLYSSRAPRARKHTNDVILGVTQLLDPRTSVSVNVTWGRARGFLNDPYRLVQKNTEVFPGVFLPLTFGENRPAYREKWVGFLGLNRAFPEAHGAVEAGYRFYHDTFGTDAHTLDFAWFQRVGEKVILRPAFRFYDQSAASFYRYTVDGTTIVPFSGPPRPEGPFFSSDYRLSAFRAYTYGLKLVWTISDTVQVDVAREQYDMHGRDGITPASAYVNARIVTVGARIQW
jgi:hypothetical protein